MKRKCLVVGVVWTLVGAGARSAPAAPIIGFTQMLVVTIPGGLPTGTVNNPNRDNVFTGLAIASGGTTTYAYAANFKQAARPMRST